MLTVLSEGEHEALEKPPVVVSEVKLCPPPPSAVFDCGGVCLPRRVRSMLLCSSGSTAGERSGFGELRRGAAEESAGRCCNGDTPGEGLAW